MKKTLGKLSAIVIATLLLTSLFSTTAFAAPVASLPDNTTERVLNLYKYSPTNASGDPGDGTEDTGAATGRTPLEDVEFEIYKVPDTQTTSDTPSSGEIAAIQVAGNLVDTVSTNAQGLATYTFGAGSASDGIYMIVEKPNPAVETPAAPFYVSIPLTSPTEDAWLYTVTVYPKNDVPEGPTVDKDLSGSVDSASFDIGDTQT
jgi:hypothetical protein